MPHGETVTVSTDGRVAIVTLGRRYVDEALAVALGDACVRLDQDDQVWVVILRGGGEAFCLGTEPTALDRLARGDTSLLDRLRVAEAVGRLSKPVVACMEGDALGQGLEVALACDLRVAQEGVRMAMDQVTRGLMAWDGGTQRLPRLVGRARAAELLLTGRAVGAREALDMGLVNALAPSGQAMEAALALARQMATHGPIAMRYLKEAVLKGLDLTLDQGLRLEADLSFLLHTTEDRAEGLRSFLEKRRPRFQGR